MARTKDALKILEVVTGRDPIVREAIANAKMNFDIAQLIYNARTNAALTQRELADLIGSRQSVISRLEDADYDGHSLSMLQRVGDALGMRLELRFVPRPRKGPRVAKPASSPKRLLRQA